MVGAPERRERATPSLDRTPVASISEIEVSENRVQLPRVALALAQSIQQLFQTLRSTTDMNIDPMLTNAAAIEQEFQADPSFFQFSSDDEEENLIESDADSESSDGANILSDYDLYSPIREEENPPRADTGNKSILRR